MSFIFKRAILSGFTILIFSTLLCSQFLVSSQNNGGCENVVEVVASGSAGPFEIFITSTSSMDTFTLSQNLEGKAVISDLCNGEYGLIAINRFDCIHDLGNIILASNSITNSVVDKKSIKRDKPLRITHFPNPFSEDVTIRIESENERNLHFLITDMVGRKVYEEDVHAVRGVNDILVNQLSNAAEGVYMVRVTESVVESGIGRSILIEGGMFRIIKTH